MKKTCFIRVADILGNPELEQKTGMNRQKYETLAKVHGTKIAREKRLPVEVDV